MNKSAGVRNRPISTFVAAFAASSLVASVLPLLTIRGEASLLPLLDRDSSFAVYTSFLLLFIFFFLPIALRREPNNSVGPWWALAGFALLFGAVPSVLSAYISGVARPQALFIGGLVACACAGVILLRSLLGRRATEVTFALGGLTLFVIPAIEAFCWSTGARLAAPVANLSLTSLVRRYAFLRQPVDPTAIMIAAAVLWALVLLLVMKRGRAGRAAGIALVMLPAAAGLFQAPPEVRVLPVLGGAVRAGARIPVVITGKGGGSAEIVLRSEALRIPLDGQPREALITLVPSESDVEVVSAGARVRVPLALKWIEPQKTLLATLADGPFTDATRAAAPSAEVFPIDLAAVPRVPGALEVFDAVVVEADRWDALNPKDRAFLISYGATSGAIVIVGAPKSDTKPAGPSLRTIATLDDLRATDLRRRIDPDPFDPTLKSLFARPDWQALDLTKLLLFLLLYHGAFLVAFLVPLLLDSHKSQSVYLVSVGGVLIVVVAVAWWSLRQFFLRDNQIYTQSLTYVAIGSEDVPSVARQFRCYASMSGERRDFAWPLEHDLVAYRDLGPAERVLDVSSARRLDQVWLDRFHAKLLVREDIASRPSLMLVRDNGGYRVRPVPEVPDPLGLRAATFTAAAVIDKDGTIRSATVDGNRIQVGPPVSGSGAAAFDHVARALLGRFRRGPGSGPLVLIRARGVKRLDDTSGFFKTADLDAVIAFEM